MTRFTLSRVTVLSLISAITVGSCSGDEAAKDQMARDTSGIMPSLTSVPKPTASRPTKDALCPRGVHCRLSRGSMWSYAEATVEGTNCFEASALARTAINNLSDRIVGRAKNRFLLVMLILKNGRGAEELVGNAVVDLGKLRKYDGDLASVHGYGDLKEIVEVTSLAKCARHGLPGLSKPGAAI